MISATWELQCGMDVAGDREEEVGHPGAKLNRQHTAPHPWGPLHTGTVPQARSLPCPTLSAEVCASIKHGGTSPMPAEVPPRAASASSSNPASSAAFTLPPAARTADLPIARAVSSPGRQLHPQSLPSANGTNSANTSTGSTRGGAAPPRYPQPMCTLRATLEFHPPPTRAPHLPAVNGAAAVSEAAPTAPNGSFFADHSTTPTSSVSHGPHARSSSSSSFPGAPLLSLPAVPAAFPPPPRRRVYPAATSNPTLACSTSNGSTAATHASPHVIVNGGATNCSTQSWMTTASHPWTAPEKRKTPHSSNSTATSTSTTSSISSGLISTPTDVGKDLPQGLLPVCARGTVRGTARARPPSNCPNRYNRRRIPSLTTLVLGTTLGLALALALLAWLPPLRRAPLLQAATPGSRAPALLITSSRGHEAAAAAGVAGVPAGDGGSARRAPGLHVASRVVAGAADGYVGDGVGQGSSGSWEGNGEGGRSTQRLDDATSLSPQLSLAPNVLPSTDLYGGAEAEAIVEAEAVMDGFKGEEAATDAPVDVAEARVPDAAPLPKRSSSIATVIGNGIPSPDPAPGGTASSPAVDPAAISFGPTLGPSADMRPPPLAAGPAAPVVPHISSGLAMAPPPLAAGRVAPHEPWVFLGELSSTQARVPLSQALDLPAWKHLALRLPQQQQQPQDEGREDGGGVDGRQLQEEEEMRSLWGQEASAADGEDRRPGAGRGPGPVRLLVAVISRCCDPESVLKRHAIRRTWGSSLGRSWSMPPPAARTAATSGDGEGNIRVGSSRKVSQWTRATIWDPHTVDLLFVLAQPPADQLHAAERVLAEEVQQVRQLRRQQAAGAGAAADGQEGWGSRLEGAAAAAAAVESDENVRGLAEGDDDGVDIVMVPGLDTYRNLPNKTLRMLQLALSSPRQYTHIAKVDDDVYLRPYNLLYDVVLGANRPSRKGLGGAAAGTGSSGGEEDSGLALPPAAVHEENGGQGGGSSGGQAGVDASRQQAGYRAAGGGGGGGDGSSRNGELGSQGLFIGGASGWFSHATDGFQPVRDPLSKWYLSPSELSDSDAPLGAPYPVGWAYAMSRDVAHKTLGLAVRFTRQPDAAPRWWGRLPWEDVTMGALAQVCGVPLLNHPGFKHPFMSCGPDTVAKHVDNLAPGLLYDMHEDEVLGRWRLQGADCGRGLYEADNFTSWRIWRNTQPDVALTGRI